MRPQSTSGHTLHVRSLLTAATLALVALACSPASGPMGDGADIEDAAPPREIDASGFDASSPDAGAAALSDAGDSLDAPSLPQPPSLDCERDDAHRYACCVLTEVNGFRAEQDPSLAPYIADPALATVGFAYAEYMAERGTFAHSADGRTFGERLDAYGVAWVSAGENLQRNTLSDWRAACEETVRGAGGWARSTAGHREAMLGRDPSGSPRGWTHAAAGIARTGRDWYVAMYFVRY